MALRNARGEVTLASAARTASSTSGPVAVPGAATAVIVGVHTTLVSGTDPTLDVSLEESTDNSSWSAITGSAAAQITAAGNKVLCADVVKNYVRVKYVIGGTDTPTFTFSASVLTFSD